MTNWWLLYTKKNCPYCVKAKELLAVHGEDYKEIDVTDNQYLRDQLKAEGFKTVPIIYCGDVYMGGYDELSKYFNDLVEAKTIKRIKKYGKDEGKDFPHSG